jgi:transcriptional regulator with XRE-family HTH domain
LSLRTWKAKAVAWHGPGVATPFEQAVAKRLRDARVRSGWTQEQLAERIAIEPATLSRYERGGSSIPLDVLRRAAAALGTTVGRLIDVEGELPKRLAPAPQTKRRPRSSEEVALLKLWSGLRPRDRRLVLLMCKSMGDINRGSRRASAGPKRGQR